MPWAGAIPCWKSKLGYTQSKLYSCWPLSKFGANGPSQGTFLPINSIGTCWEYLEVHVGCLDGIRARGKSVLWARYYIWTIRARGNACKYWWLSNIEKTACLSLCSYRWAIHDRSMWWTQRSTDLWKLNSIRYFYWWSLTWWISVDGKLLLNHRVIW